MKNQVMKKIGLSLVCVFVAGVVAWADMDKESAKMPAPPLRVKHPSAYPPGPEREAARQRLEEWRLHNIAQWEARIQARHEAELKAKLENPEHGPYFREVEKATDANGTVHLWRMPEWARQRAITEARRSEALGKMGRVPSEKFLAIVGDRPDAEQREILSAVVASSVERARAPGRAVVKVEDRIKAIRCAIRPGIIVTDEQVVQLLSVTPIELLWKKSE